MSDVQPMCNPASRADAPGKPWEEARALNEQIEALEEDNRRLLERLVAGRPA